MPWFWSLDIYTWSERGKSQGFNICPSFASSFSDALGSGLEPRSVLQILLFLLSDAMKHTVNMYVRVGWNKLKFFAVWICCEKNSTLVLLLGHIFHLTLQTLRPTHGKSHGLMENLTLYFGKSFVDGTWRKTKTILSNSDFNEFGLNFK